MKKDNTLRVVPDSSKEPLTYDQLTALASAVSHEIGQSDDLSGLLMLLTREVINHCHNPQHVETVAMLLEDHLYTATADFDRAQRRFIAAKRDELLRGGKG